MPATGRGGCWGGTGKFAAEGKRTAATEDKKILGTQIKDLVWKGRRVGEATENATLKPQPRGSGNKTKFAADTPCIKMTRKHAKKVKNNLFREVPRCAQP